MSLKLSLVHAKEETKVTNIQAFAMVLLGQRCEVPCLQPMDTKLDALYSFELRLLDELFHIFLWHPMVLIVVKILLLLDIFVLVVLFTDFFFFLLRDFCVLCCYLSWIEFEEVFCYPSIHTSVLTQVMDVILISHWFRKLSEFFLL